MSMFWKPRELSVLCIRNEPAMYPLFSFIQAPGMGGVGMRRIFASAFFRGRKPCMEIVLWEKSIYPTNPTGPDVLGGNDCLNAMKYVLRMSSYSDRNAEALAYNWSSSTRLWASDEVSE